MNFEPRCAFESDGVRCELAPAPGDIYCESCREAVEWEAEVLHQDDELHQSAGIAHAATLEERG